MRDSYNVEVSRAVAKQIYKLGDRSVQTQIARAIKDLENNPRPNGAIKLTGRQAWRIRVGTYRIIYKIHDDRLLVIVVRVAHRRQAY